MKAKIISLTSGIVFFIATIVFASDGTETGLSVNDLIWKVLNFTILVVLLVKFVGKPLKNFLKQRKELIEKSIKEAQEAKGLAQKALADVELRLKDKDKEIEDIISISKSLGEEERARLIAEGERVSVKITEQARNNIDFEIKKAKDVIQREAVEAAIKLAEAKIKPKITKAKQDKLLQESIKLIRGKN